MGSQQAKENDPATMTSPPVQRVFQERLGCSLLQHSVVLLTAGCLCSLQGFTMIPGSGANSRLALTAHYKTFLHAALMAAAGSASSAGACASLGRTAGICSFWLLAGGCWLSFYADVRASFLGIGLPMAATVQLHLCQDDLDLYVRDSTRSDTRSQCTYSDLSLPRRGRQRCTKGTIALTTDGTMHLACVCVCVCVCMCVRNVHGEDVFDGVCGCQGRQSRCRRGARQ